MKKFYQNEWQNIAFSDIYEVSSTKLAGPEFYDSFYLALFEKYSDYESLDCDWRRSKDEITDWLATLLPDGSRVLSVGCGLGYMEQRLWRNHGDRIELHVQDYASVSLDWLRRVLPPERIHETGGSRIGATPGGCFDLICLSAVDYAMSDEDLISLLCEARHALCDGGRIVMISASFLETSFGHYLIQSGKDSVKWLLEKVGIRKRGQFWGWMRSRQQYQSIMRAACITSVVDGFVETPHQRTYWIQGKGMRSL